MSTKRDYYEVLGVAKTAATDEIKKSYRKLAMQYHPDRNPGDKQAENKFKEATEAYEVLSNQEKRQKYDQYGHAGMQGGADFHQYTDFADIFENFGDIFGSMFEGAHPGAKKRKKSGPTPQRGHDLAQEVTLSLKESFAGIKKEIGIYRYVACEHCTATGCTAGTTPTKCTQCQGAGQIVMRQGIFSFAQPCNACWGQGFTIAAPCKTCKGQSRIQKHERINVTIPAGIYNGAELRLASKGDAGVFGGPAGDLFITVHVQEDRRFSRRENDLVTRLTLTYPQLVLGCQVEIESIDGSSEMVKIPQGCPVGKEIIIKEGGFKKLQGRGAGDLVIVTHCDIPTQLSAEAKKKIFELAEQLGNQSQGNNGITGFFKKFLG